MKNPFEKENKKGLVVAIVIGSVVAAGLAYLFLTEDGEELLNDLKQKIKETAKDIVSGALSDKTGISKKTVKKAADVVAE